MAITNEPNFKNENELRDGLINEIRAILSDTKRINDFCITKSEPLDIYTIISKLGDQLSVKFIEVKHYSPQNNRIGFSGFQVDLLIRKEEELSWLNHCISWVFGDKTKPLGTERFVLLDNVQAKKCAANGVKRGKQNNFTISKISANLVSWSDLSQKIKNYLLDS